MLNNNYFLPIGDSYDDAYRVQVLDQTYTFRFRWNTYEEAWECYIGFVGEDPSIKFKVTNGFDLLTPYRHLDGVPNAVLVAIDDFYQIGRVNEDVGQLAEDRFKLLLSY